MPNEYVGDYEQVTGLQREDSPQVETISESAPEVETKVIGAPETADPEPQTVAETA